MMSSVGVSFINSFLDDKTDQHTVLHPLVLQVPGTPGQLIMSYLKTVILNFMIPPTRRLTNNRQSGNSWPTTADSRPTNGPTVSQQF